MTYEATKLNINFYYKTQGFENLEENFSNCFLALFKFYVQWSVNENFRVVKYSITTPQRLLPKIYY